MKKTLLSIAFAAFALCGFAQTTTTYTDDLVISINGAASAPQETEIYVTEDLDGTYTLSLNNFKLITVDDVLYVGNIKLSGIETTEENGIKTFSVNQVINITEGDAEGVETWLGPMLGDVPIVLSAKMTTEKLYCTIDIDMMSSLGQIIEVVFGTDEFNTTPELGATTTYTDDLVISINGAASAPQETEIYVTEDLDGTYTLSLNNFKLITVDDVLYVGNIKLSGIETTEENGIKTFSVNQVINITEGDAEGVETWLGPMLGDVPIVLSAKMTTEKLYCTIDIDMMSSLGQIIEVVFGTDEFNTIPEGGDGIENVTAADAKVNVYNLQGVVVKTNVNIANALDGLKQGIYIVNGKKVVK